MSDNERDQAREASRAARQQQVAQGLVELGVTPAEASLFYVIHFGMNDDPEHLPQRAAIKDYNIGGRSDVAQCTAALTACLEKRWLQVIDENTLVQLQVDVSAAGLLGPIYGWPRTGGVDFTRDGAALWEQICDRCYARQERPPSAYTDVVFEKSTHYFRSRNAAVLGTEKLLHVTCGTEIKSVSAPEPIGA